MQLCWQRAGTAFFAVALLALAAAPGWAITAGYTDTFNDGMLHDWRIGQPDPYPQIVLNNGADGAGDHSLYMATSGAGSTRPRLVVMHDTFDESGNWEGNWTAAGITNVEFDVLNTNAFTLNMRLVIAGPGGFYGEASGDTYITDAIDILPNATTWQRISFPVLASDFNPLGGLNAAAALTGISHFRILHNPIADGLGAQLIVAPGGKFYLDNITAVAVPQALAGDYNGNGVVDAADCVVWRDTQNQSVMPGSGADGDGNGTINDLDYSYWRARFGNTAAGAGGALTAVAVPEPASWLGMTGLFIFAWFLVRTWA